MEKTEIVAKIEELVTEILNDIDDVVIQRDDDLYKKSSMSSIDYVKVLVNLEELYDIEFDDTTLIYQEGITINGIAQIVCDLLNI